MEIKNKNKILESFSEENLNIFNIDELYECYKISHTKRYFVAYIKGLENFDNIVDNFKNLLNYRASLLANKKRNYGTYDPLYISLKKNITLDKAKEYVLKTKSDKATSREKFIERHGLEEGNKKFEKFQLTSFEPHKKRKSLLSEKEEYEWQRKNSKRCPEYYLTRGLAKTYDDAKNMVSEHQLKSVGVNIQYYLYSGFSFSEASSIIQIINSKKDAYNKWRLALPKEDFLKRVNERYKKYSQTLGSLSYKGILDEYQSYKREVWKHTNLNLIIYKEKIADIEKRGRIQGKSLDHIYSIKQGFLEDIDPEIIGHWTNLSIVDEKYNMSKQSRCDKDKVKLIEDYKESVK